MATVYGLLSLNIAATASRDGSKGCFFERDPVYVRGHRVKIGHYQENIFCTVSPEALIRQDVDDAPLSSRAWVAQERVLAPRKIHFAASQLFWECRTKRACETFPEEIPVDRLYLFPYIPTRELPRSWDGIVRLYSRGTLTRWSDRLVAIAGIAHKFQEQNDDQYVAGLWVENFKKYLCWTVDQDVEPAYSQQINPGIPSWSWAALGMPVKLRPHWFKGRGTYVDIIDVHVTLDSNDLFGNVKDGFLVIHAKSIIRCTIISYAMKLCRISIGNSSFVGAVHWDHREHDGPVVFLPIGHVYSEQSSGGDVLGLLLQSKTSRDGTYERVGLVSSSLRQQNEKLSRIINIYQQGQSEILGISKGHSHSITEKDYTSVNVDKDGQKLYAITTV